jgi:AbrB family looped-hinge helix DNA binding protein
MTSKSVSRLTRKYQATIPAPVREALALAAGDAVVFEVTGGVVRLRKAQPLDLRFAEALAGTLSEWHSKADDDAYRDL